MPVVTVVCSFYYLMIIVCAVCVWGVGFVFVMWVQWVACVYPLSYLTCWPCSFLCVTESHFVAQVYFELFLLTQPSKCWDHRYEELTQLFLSLK